MISNDSYLSGDPYDLAYHRYADALMNNEINAYRIISSISLLEALLTGDEGTEITFKIRMRIGKLLSMFGYNPLNVSDHINSAYSLRSKLIHGSKLKQALVTFAREHTKDIINYNRICLLVALQTKNVIKKEEFISLVDNSLLDKPSEKKLKDLIHQNVLIPNPHPFIQRETN